MNFFNRLQGVFFNPQITLKTISERPVWVDTLIFILIVLTVFTLIVAPYVKQDKLHDLKNDIKLQERLGEERHQQQVEFWENTPKALFILFFVIVPLIANLIGYLLPCLVILGIGRMFSSEGTYKQIFSVFLHASIVDRFLGNVIRIILVFTRKSVVQTTTSLALFFPKWEVTSPGFKILSQFDFFQLWLFGILGYGLSYIFKIELKKALFISYGFWFLKSLLYVVLGILFPQAM